MLGLIWSHWRLHTAIEYIYQTELVTEGQRQISNGRARGTLEFDSVYWYSSCLRRHGRVPALFLSQLTDYTRTTALTENFQHLKSVFMLRVLTNFVIIDLL